MIFDFLSFKGFHGNFRAAPVQRNWMDKTHQKYAYRCLPLNVANSYGWQFIVQEPFTASWNGEDGLDAVKIFPQNGPREHFNVISNFGYGILTFHVGGVIRTEPNYDLFVMGPANIVKHGISPLTGVVESDWIDSTFTMNWKFTAPGEISFRKDEPFCQVFPVQKGILGAFDPRIIPEEADKELKADVDLWGSRRKKFSEDLKNPHSEASKLGWQGDYFHGKRVDGSKVPNHLTKSKVRPPKEIKE